MMKKFLSLMGQEYKIDKELPIADREHELAKSVKEEYEMADKVKQAYAEREEAWH